MGRVSAQEPAGRVGAPRRQAYRCDRVSASHRPRTPELRQAAGTKVVVAFEVVYLLCLYGAILYQETLAKRQAVARAMLVGAVESFPVPHSLACGSFGVWLLS